MEQHQSSVSMGASSSSSATACHTNVTTTRTILRIKRRRTEDPLSYLRLEGVTRSVPQHINGNGTLDREEESYQQQSHTASHTFSKKRSYAVLWKRFDPEMEASSASNTTAANRYRIVNAMFVDNQNQNDQETEDAPRSKRRKLTVLDTATTSADTTEGSADTTNNATSPLHSLLTYKTLPQFHPSPKKKSRQPLKILDPLTRIIDDSLQEVFVGSKTCESHYALLTTDSRFTFQGIEKRHKWMTHTTSHGNLLHCCALWNDASTANQLLQYAQQQSSGSSSSSTPSSSSSSSSLQTTLLETTDGDGRTPYQVAQVVQHQQVADVLEMYGGDDATNYYVYDIFYVDSSMEDNYMNDINNSSSDDDGMNGDGDAAAGDNEYRNQAALDDNDNDTDNAVVPMMMTAELTSGVGYWTPEGELVLEADERNARSLSHETDGDIDSNCEEYGANDYPDEEEEEEEGAALASARRWMDQMAFADYNHDDNRDYNHVGDGYDESHGDDDDGENGMFLQVNDNYDEYDWEEDLDNEQDRRQHFRQNPYDYDDD